MTFFRDEKRFEYVQILTGMSGWLTLNFTTEEEKETAFKAMDAIAKNGLFLGVINVYWTNYSGSKVVEGEKK